MKTSEAVLIENLQQFVGFARKRVGDPHLAEDVVQESLLKALQADRMPSSDEDVVAWFYRILRRSIIDLYRRKEVRTRALEKFEAEFSESPTHEMEREVCGCLRKLMADMPAQYSEVLERVDIAGAAVKDVAKQLGESANNLTVRLHRARKQLRARVEECCQVTTVAGCLECSCDPN
jgi:RNA polymerase sigma factor (sigma-70 family)